MKACKPLVQRADEEQRPAGELQAELLASGLGAPAKRGRVEATLGEPVVEQANSR